MCLPPEGRMSILRQCSRRPAAGPGRRRVAYVASSHASFASRQNPSRSSHLACPMLQVVVRLHEHRRISVLIAWSYLHAIGTILPFDRMRPTPDLLTAGAMLPWLLVCGPDRQTVAHS